MSRTGCLVIVLNGSFGSNFYGSFLSRVHPTALCQKEVNSNAQSHDKVTTDHHEPCDHVATTYVSVVLINQRSPWYSIFECTLAIPGFGRKSTGYTRFWHFCLKKYRRIPICHLDLRRHQTLINVPVPACRPSAYLLLDCHPDSKLSLFWIFSSFCLPTAHSRTLATPRPEKWSSLFAWSPCKPVTSQSSCGSLGQNQLVMPVAVISLNSQQGGLLKLVTATSKFPLLSPPCRTCFLPCPSLRCSAPSPIFPCFVI